MLYTDHIQNDGQNGGLACNKSPYGDDEWCGNDLLSMRRDGESSGNTEEFSLIFPEDG